jgi:hypothetical protein
MGSKASTMTVPMAKAQMTKAIFLYGIETPKKSRPKAALTKQWGSDPNL